MKALKQQLNFELRAIKRTFEEGHINNIQRFKLDFAAETNFKMLKRMVTK